PPIMRASLRVKARPSPVPPLAFVLVERGLRSRVGLFAPLRDKVTYARSNGGNQEDAGRLGRLVQGRRALLRRHREGQRDNQLLFCAVRCGAERLASGSAHARVYRIA